jgi:CP family cyanate transporter-like MFS transporter
VAGGESPGPRGPGLAFAAAVVLVSLNLRTVFASLPPLLEDVRDDLGLSAGVAGLLTAGPVLCFGALAPIVPRLVSRVPIELVVGVCAALTALGAGLRGVDGTATLFAGTLLAGAAVAVAQTALPALFSTRFPGRGGSLTGGFSMSLTLGAAVASGAAVPLERALGGWRGALAIFAVPAALAAAVWLAPVSRTRTLVHRVVPLRLRGIRGSWSVAGFFGLQSMAFYAGLTWLPTIVEDAGYSEGAAGALQALANGIQFLPAFLVPVFAARRPDQTRIMTATVSVAVVALVGLLLAPGVAVVWIVLLGLAQGGSLGLALMLPVLRGGTPQAVAALTAMALSIGYLVAAIGPALLGVAHDLSDGWDVPLVLLVAITAAELAVGIPGARAWKVAAGIDSSDISRAERGA